MTVFRTAAFVDEATCGRIRQAMDQGEAEPAEILSEDRSGVKGRIELAPSQRPAVRRATSVEIEDSVLALVDNALEQSREPVRAFFGLDLDSREGPGFLRYPAGGFYKRHRDRGMAAAWPDAARRLVTLVLFLNDDFRGGELRLLADDEEPLLVHPATGTLVAFDAGTVHEVLPVADGRRYTVVDWWLGRTTGLRTTA